MKTKKELIQEAKMIKDSLAWWKNEMSLTTSAVELWDNCKDHPDYEQEMGILEGKMLYLVAKGSVEYRLMGEVQKEISCLDAAETLKNRSIQKNKNGHLELSSKNKRNKEGKPED